MDVVGIEIGVGIAAVIAIVGAAFAIHLKFLQRTVEREVRVRRTELWSQIQTSHVATVGRQRLTSFELWPMAPSSAQAMRAVRRKAPREAETANLIAEAEGITARSQTLKASSDLKDNAVSPAS